MLNSKDCSFLPPPRILTRGRILVLILGLLALTANAMADVVERSNPNNEYTASGSNLYEVQTADNAANKDVIVINASHQTTRGVYSNNYSVTEFTVKSAVEGTKMTITIPTFSTETDQNYRYYTLSTANVDYKFTFKDLEFQGTNSNINHFGLFLTTAKSNSVTLNLDNVTFTKFKGAGGRYGWGGVIRTTAESTLNLEGDNVVFDHNQANYGGAIIDANDNNSTATGNLNINIKNLTFSNNIATSSSNDSDPIGAGGAIYMKKGNINITADTVTFENNDATASTTKGDGGAIFINQGNLTLSAGTITFKNNSSYLRGGGICQESITDTITITGNNITFEDNSVIHFGGAAVRGHFNITGKDSQSKIIFKNNTAGGSSHPDGFGGALVARGNSSILSTGEFTFENNTATSKGGAIYVANSLTFSGNNTSATFTGNSAPKGNDIYTETASSVLTFEDGGTYSFDGGIYQEYSDSQIVINKAQVTISGRKNDTTNVYQLQNVTISNGGKLTANLDYIDSLTGTFNVSGATEETKGTLELNVSDNVVKKLNADSFKVVRTDLGEVVKTGDGTLQLCNEAQDMIDINGLVVSSGRMDILGYMTGGITVQPDSVFSPGNSVGDARFGGGYELKEDAMLLIEQDASGIDTLTATSFDIDSNSIIDFAADSLQPGASYDIIFQTDSEGNPKNFTGAQATDDFWNNLLTPESAYYWNLSVSGNVVRASVDPNAVPEPSTWALLILGAAGLLYVRKRRN